MVLVEAVALGLILSLYLSDLVGFVAGGLIVPGYMALIIDKPKLLIGTLLASILTWVLLKVISRFALIFGRRRLVLAVLLGFALGEMSRALTQTGLAWEVQAFGFVIPGLIAYWMENQGVIETLSMMVILAIIIHFILLLLHGGAPLLP